VTASRTSASRSSGSPPEATIATRFRRSASPARRSNDAAMNSSRFSTASAAMRACSRASITSSRSEELTSRLASDTSWSPSDEPSTIPIPSARKTATSDSAW
jgi:hypothetical protein